ncbi:MAG: radical SAM protein [Clostridia bacterium]|nr:radical SAM protein [Clostridia bacterium]
MKELEECRLCPFECKVNREKGEVGRCKATDKIKLGLVTKHFGEEPCISGESGSGTVFFSNCNLKCKFCQNYKISSLGKGEEISINELADIFLKHQKEGANNINLVTPTPYVIQIIKALKIAKSKGLSIPIVYNTSGYEKVEVLKLLEGYVDVYLPDFKYLDDDLALRLSGAKNYSEYTTKALLEMQRQIDKTEIDENGIMKKGMIIRHLILPNHIDNSKKVLKWIKENMREDIYVSLMAQYFPTYKAKEIEDINRKLTYEEYKEVEDYLFELDIKNGFVQDLEDEEEKYVPEF